MCVGLGASGDLDGACHRWVRWAVKPLSWFSEFGRTMDPAAVPEAEDGPALLADDAESILLRHPHRQFPDLLAEDHGLLET